MSGEVIQHDGLTLVAYDPAAIHHAVDRLGKNRARYRSGAEVLAARPAAVAVLDGAMFDSGGRLRYRYLDRAHGVDEPGTHPGDGGNIHIVDGRAALGHAALAPVEASFVAQGWPVLVVDGKNVSPQGGNLEEHVWRAAVCILADGRIALAVMHATMHGFAAALVAAGVVAAVYTDGGHSARILMRDGRHWGSTADPAVASWIVAEEDHG